MRHLERSKVCRNVKGSGMLRALQNRQQFRNVDVGQVGFDAIHVIEAFDKADSGRGRVVKHFNVKAIQLEKKNGNTQ